MESWGPFAEGKNDMFRNEVLSTMARSTTRAVAQVIVRWLTQRGVVAIPKSVRPDRMAENFDVFDFELTPEDMASVATLDPKKRAAFSTTVTRR